MASQARASSPLRAKDRSLPADIRRHIEQARSSWLSNTAIAELIRSSRTLDWDVQRVPPRRPPGGTLFLYDRKVIKFFRKDSHDWTKKTDGKTVRETHEKLKIDNQDLLNCYYAHPQKKDAPQRRCYWLLDGAKDIVLVHYLVARSKASGGTNPDAGQRSYTCGERPESVQAVSCGKDGLYECTPSSPDMAPSTEEAELTDLIENSRICASAMRSTSLDVCIPRNENENTGAQGLRQRSKDESSNSVLPSPPELMYVPASEVMLPAFEQEAGPLQKSSPSRDHLQASPALTNPRFSKRPREQPGSSLQWIPCRYMQAPSKVGSKSRKAEPQTISEQAFDMYSSNPPSPNVETMPQIEAYHEGLNESMNVSPTFPEKDPSRQVNQSHIVFDRAAARGLQKLHAVPVSQACRVPSLSGNDIGRTAGPAPGQIAEVSDRERNRAATKRVQLPNWVQQSSRSGHYASQSLNAAVKVNLSAFKEHAKSFAGYDDIPELDEEQHSEISEREQQDRGKGPAQMQPGRMLPLHNSPFLLHKDYAPKRDTIRGGAKMILTCSCSTPPCTHLYVCFGREEVMAAKISPGIESISPCVIKVRVPPNRSGKVNIFLTIGDGRPLSNSLPFYYLEA